MRGVNVSQIEISLALFPTTFLVAVTYRSNNSDFVRYYHMR